MEKQRIQKIISQSGITSRRKAEEFILQGIVKINNVVAHLGDKASYEDVISVNNQVISVTKKEYYLLNKPKKTICTTNDPQNRWTVVDIINTKASIFPVGRLDYNTTGIIFLTNDGEFMNNLLHPRFEISREYVAILNEELTKNELQFLNSNEVIIDNKISIQKVSALGQKKYSVILKQGWNHHVKKIFGSIDKFIIDLDRVSFANFTYGNLKPGEYRLLSQLEIKKLKYNSGN